jgi:hypothetical protein
MNQEDAVVSYLKCNRGINLDSNLNPTTVPHTFIAFSTRATCP